MRAVIIGNGSINDAEKIKALIKREDFIICADGGYRYASAMGLRADVLLGDFDSIGDMSMIADEIIQYPTRKNFTDGELCVDYALKQGFDEILLVGMTGTRIDHTINNILLLFRCEKGCLIDDNNEIYPVTDRLIIENKKGKTLSLIPLCGDMESVVTSGLEYPLNNETLYFGQARGNSNVITDDICEISVKGGKGIAVVNNGE